MSLPPSLLSKPVCAKHSSIPAFPYQALGISPTVRRSQGGWESLGLGPHTPGEASRQSLGWSVPPALPEVPVHFLGSSQCQFDRKGEKVKGRREGEERPCGRSCFDLGLREQVGRGLLETREERLSLRNGSRSAKWVQRFCEGKVWLSQIVTPGFPRCLFESSRCPV